MKLNICLLLVLMLIISGCGITGNVAAVGVSREQAINIADAELREMQGVYHNIVMDASKEESHWVINSIGENTRVFWVNRLTGEIDCMNTNTRQPIDCL